MSEFQISLLTIGAIVIIGVYGYGYWQQWRYRRSLGQAFAVLAEEPPAKPLPETAPVQPADEPLAQSVTASIPAEPVRDACAQLDEKMDYIVSLTPKLPLGAQALEGFWQRRFDYGKTIHACGCNAASGVWERLIPESPASYRAFRIGMQLVDRDGAVTDTRLSDFRELLGGIARRMEADVVQPEADSALGRARELDKFCAEVDQMIGINLMPGGERALFASEVARAVQQAGMSLQADGTFHKFDHAGATLFTLSASDGTPFQHHTLDQMRVHALTLLLDIPRVSEPARRFDEMTQHAAEFATALRATLVDDQRVTLGKGAVEQIHAQVAAVEQRMLAGGVVPGSAMALRLFS